MVAKDLPSTCLGRERRLRVEVLVRLRRRSSEEEEEEEAEEADAISLLSFFFLLSLFCKVIQRLGTEQEETEWRQLE